METYIAVHKTFDKKDAISKRQVVLYVSDGERFEKIAEKGIQKWIDSLDPNTSLRFTSVHACDPLLLDLAARGFTVTYANWHATGIEKNLPAEEIALKYAVAPEDIFRTFSARPDLVELRQRVAQRQAILEYRKAAVLKLKGIARMHGDLDGDDYSESTLELLKSVDVFDVTVPFTGENGKTKNVSIETVIAKLAEKTRECVLFNSAAHIEGSWGTAATVVSFSGGMDRFDTVAAFWHYCGEHVVDGHAPKRAKGKPVDWSPKLRTALWQMSDSIIKNRNNPWRDFYEVELTKELAVHEVKHPGCKTPQGHCGARSRRKLRKEILKRFYLACQGTEFESGGHLWSENHEKGAAA